MYHKYFVSQLNNKKLPDIINFYSLFGFIQTYVRFVRTDINYYEKEILVYKTVDLALRSKLHLYL